MLTIAYFKKHRHYLDTVFPEFNQCNSSPVCHWFVVDKLIRMIHSTCLKSAAVLEMLFSHYLKHFLIWRSMQLIFQRMQFRSSRYWLITNGSSTSRIQNMIPTEFMFGLQMQQKIRSSITSIRTLWTLCWSYLHYQRILHPIWKPFCRIRFKYCFLCWEWLL